MDYFCKEKLLRSKKDGKVYDDGGGGLLNKPTQVSEGQVGRMNDASPSENSSQYLVHIMYMITIKMYSGVLAYYLKHGVKPVH